MRYGNFVGKTDIPHTETEIKQFNEFMRDALGSANAYCAIERYEPSWNTEALFIKVMLPHTLTGRDMHGNRFTTTGLTLAVHKHKGYLEVGETFPKMHDYENAPEFSYGAYLTFDGSMIEYRKRTRTGIWIEGAHTYAYGTEIKDLEDLTKSIRRYFDEIVRYGTPVEAKAA